MPSSPHSQTRISSFFSQPSSSSSPLRKSHSKRAASPIEIDLTVDSGDDDVGTSHILKPAVKKRKLTALPHRPTSSPSHASSSAINTAEQWRFDPSLASPTKQECIETSSFSANSPVKEHAPETLALKKQRREAFRKKLLLDNNPFLKRKDVSMSSLGDTLEVDSDAGPGDGETSGNSGDDSDEAFKKLTEMFSNKTQGKGKGKAKAKAPPKAKVVEPLGPSGKSYTPLEKQVLQLKKDNPGTVLMVEVGYKYKFFGDDAKIAAKDLGMVAFQDRNFVVASIPTHRRDVHLKKLLSQGHRVGIVDQAETAALKKVGDNRNAPFERKLAHLYTAATYVDGLDSTDDFERYTPPPFMCIMEEKKTADKEGDVRIGFVSISSSTGDVVWDEFDDTPMRLELETRLVHTKPTELLLHEGGLTKATEKMLSHFTSASAGSSKIRIERFDEAMAYTEAFTFVSDFCKDQKTTAGASEKIKSGEIVAIVADFPKRVVVALAHAIQYLSTFGIANAFLETKFFNKFTAKTHMLLAANTLTNLEIYNNETDYTTRGSLIWILDRTKTKFGARLLRSWIGRPLIDKAALQERVDAVEEIRSSTSDKLVTLRQLLKKIPDLAKGLCRIQYGQCTPQELAVLLPIFRKIAFAFDPIEKPYDAGFHSGLLNEIVFALPLLRDSITELLSIVSLKQAAEGRKDTMWNDPDRYPGISDSEMALQVIEVELQDELKSIRKTLRMPSLQWKTVMGEELLIEVNRKDNKPIPASWISVNKTKYTARFRTPEVQQKLEERSQRRETLQIESQRAYISFLKEISDKHYNVMRSAVNKLATADCLLSLALIAMQDNYVKPQFNDEDTIEIVGGRHPMVEALRSDPYVPNTIRMGGGRPRNKIITGPNMGGKSSSVRMVALIVIMAQIGSYVPADSVKVGLVDSILTRMGASDDIAKGRSTFMVEMSETSEILHSATSQSLVILDELGRGTSTYDGMAIAHAVMQHLALSTMCKTLFITHYPMIAVSLEKAHPSQVENLHMGYEAHKRIDGSDDVTFLYRLTAGLASASYGIECGRLAGLPDSLLHVATHRSTHMREEVEGRLKRTAVRKIAGMLNNRLSNPKTRSTSEELKLVSEALSTISTTI